MKYKYICDSCGTEQPCILKINDSENPPRYCPLVCNCVAPWRLYRKPKKACEHVYHLLFSSTTEGTTPLCICRKCGERLELRSN